MRLNAHIKPAARDVWGRLLLKWRKGMEPAAGSANPPEYQVVEPAYSKADAQLVSSRSGGIHRPVLDLDFECRLVPSKTPGHYHLFLDELELGDAAYADLLDALLRAGVIQKGFHRQFRECGETRVRLGGR